MKEWFENEAIKTKEIIAGNDMRMPIECNPEPGDYTMLKDLNRNQMAVCVKRLLELILWLE